MKKDEDTANKLMHTEENLVNRIRKYPYFVEIVVLLGLIIFIGIFYYISVLDSRVYIEKSQITAPIVTVGTLTPGILEDVKVDIGDRVSKNKVVADVSGEPVTAKTDGIVVDVNNVPGQILTSQNYIIKVVDPKELRLIGRVEEDKGLRDIHPGEKVIFTVDAYGSQEYAGFVDKVVPTSRESDIVFSISDKRQLNEFDVIVKYDYRDYPELKNGMSAKMWVYKDK